MVPCEWRVQMSISRYNAEGHHDPTPHQALTNIAKEEHKVHFRPVVYISLPSSADAHRYCRFAVERGYIPMAPSLCFPLFMHENDPDEQKLTLFMSMVLLTKCAELWMFGDEVSPCMKQELHKARFRGMPIRRFTNDCTEVT